MKLLIPAFIIALGMLVGVAVSRVFKQTPASVWLSVLTGGMGALAGLVARDFMDITLGGPLLGAILAAIIGAVTLAAVTLLVVGFRRS